ncbi:ligase-associated DNA damage response endonuclease PdeM [Marinibacterium profundimaris]|uniref:Metallophosphoesterase n=1 Tax=Marinibacterium profundimaris TaxID=1679460 RepID=A0A225NDV5_9RHOB|nr:ligase-associated DNA damage response endonuclease PdeM [Marinibacterium profundimaris]OWU70411.1 metallophosphoesterase [Marinibacterium profundimaris]
MNALQTTQPRTHDFTLAGARLTALPSGALWWAAESLLCVSDLHLCKAERHARRGGAPLPPYETRDTLQRLSDALQATGARTVICLGDSFDDLAAARALPEAERLELTGLMAGRDWIWIEGNHDPGPVDLGGTHLAQLTMGPLTFRHIADPSARGEISGHYHPKAQVKTRLRRISRPAFLLDRDRLILPAFGTFTGGLRSTAPELSRLMRPEALAILTGQSAQPVPMPR